MKSIIVTLLSLSAAASAQYTNQSAPFYLHVLSSSNSTLNDTSLYPCHEGAAIEGLCLTGKINGNWTNASQYHLNTTTQEGLVFNETLGEPGYLAWTLVGGNFIVDSALQLSARPASNVGLPLFFPGNSSAQLVAFDSDNRLNIQDYIDDRNVSSYGYGQAQAYYRWNVCYTYYGYRYQTLAWVYGDQPAQNPTCVPVDVQRVFVSDVTAPARH